MADTLWLQNGKLIVDSLGSPLLCSTCPCTSLPPEPPATYYFYKQLIIAGCEGLPYRSNVIQFDPSTDTYLLGWNALTTYMSMGDCSGSLVLYGVDNEQIDTINIGGLFSLCLGELLLYYMGKPISCFLHTPLYSDTTGIWTTLKQLLLTIYASYSASTDDSGAGSSGAVHPDILAMFPYNTIYDLFSTAAGRLKDKALLIAQSTDDILLTEDMSQHDYILNELNKLASAVYSQYYNAVGSIAYNTYTLQCGILSKAHRESITGTESTDGIWQYYVITPFTLLTYDTTLLMYNILNDTAVASAKSTLSSYAAPDYSAVTAFLTGGDLGRYTYGAVLIVNAIQSYRQGYTSLLELLAELSTYLYPYGEYMAPRALYLAQAYEALKISASDILCLSMLTKLNTGTADLRQALWSLYQTLVLKFVNAVLQIRPIKYTWAVLKTTTLLLPEKDAYTLPTSLLACNATYSYKKYIWHCTLGMVLNKVYTAVPNQLFFNNDTAYQLLWQLQQMVSSPYALFKDADDLLFTAVKVPLTNIDSFVHIASDSVWYGLGVPTLVSPVGLEAYINNLSEMLMSYYLWGVSNGKDTISALPLVEGTLQLLYDFTTTSAPVYVLCAKQLLLDMTPHISPIGYPDTWTYTMSSITGIVTAMAEPDWATPTIANAALVLPTDKTSLPSTIKVLVDGTLVTTGYKDTATGSLWFPTKLTAKLSIAKSDYTNATLSTLLPGYKVVTQKALATVVIKAVGGANKCGSNLWSPTLLYRQFEPTWSGNAVTPYLDLEQNPYLTYLVVSSYSAELIDLEWNPVTIKTMPSMTVTADLLSLLPLELQ